MLVTTASWMRGLNGAFTISAQQRQDGFVNLFLSYLSEALILLILLHVSFVILPFKLPGCYYTR